MQSTKPHGLMFHHFYDEKHVKGQGAISADQFSKIITEYGRGHILPAQEWLERANTNSLKENDLCLTFDDALLGQYEVALPVMTDYNLTAFWFVYSSVITGNVEMLEVYRKFRTVFFDNIDDFYKAFFASLSRSEYKETVESALADMPHDYLNEHPFYTADDRKFRYVRNEILGAQAYDKAMQHMMVEYNINISEFAADLWMSTEHIKDLHSKGHVIGLHSHSHPNTLATLPVEEQEREYRLNYDILHDLLSERPTTVSHPCGSYNQATLTILDKLGILLGFRATMAQENFSRLEYPREDHANIIRTLNL